ncbi:MAG: tetratricopeptide repeat protein, partial [Stackebrandtia sp.]
AVAVAVVVAGYVGYGVAGSAVYDSGVTAQEGGDCATANGKFDTVTGPFELTLSGNVGEAAARRTECDAYEKARAAQKRKDYDAAIAQYNDFGKIYPSSVLSKHVRRDLADTHFARATSWREPLTPVDVRDSVDTLLMLRRDFAGTTAAKKAPDAITDIFAAATKPFEEGKFCESMPVLAYFADLDPSSAGDKVVTDAVNFRATALYQCGLSQVKAHDQAAIATLEQFLESYPGDGAVPQATSALITAKVELETGAQLPLPPPLGGNEPGTIPVTFYNDSNSPLTILVAGPTAHQISLPACGFCRESYPTGDPAACQDVTGRPGVTLRLTPSAYYFTTDDAEINNEASGSVTPLVGYEHWQCVYMTSY